MPAPEPRDPIPVDEARCTAAYCLIRYWVRWGVDPRYEVPVVTLLSLN